MLLTGTLILLGLLGAYYLSLYLGIKPRLGILLYIWHSMFVFIFHQYVIRYGGDAVDYYNMTLDTRLGELGSGMVLMFVKIMVEALSFSMLDCNFIFGFIGYVGLMIWLRVFLSASENNWMQLTVLLAIILMPSFSFWSAGIGKDSLLVLAMALVALSMTKPDLDNRLLIISVFIIALVRPHVAAIVGFLYIIFILSIGVMPRFYKLLAVLVLIGIFLLSEDYILKYIGYLDASGVPIYGGGVSGYFEGVSKINSIAHSGYKTESIGGVELWLGYFFRPNIWEVESALHMLVAIENLFLMACMVLLLIGRWRVKVAQIHFQRWIFLLLCFVSISVGYAMVASNFGISSRTKWMVVPLMALLMVLKPIAVRPQQDA